MITGFSHDSYYPWLQWWVRHHYLCRAESVDIDNVGSPANRFSTSWKVTDDQGRRSWRPAAP